MALKKIKNKNKAKKDGTVPADTNTDSSSTEDESIS